jgi:hypothetical protein
MNIPSFHSSVALQPFVGPWPLLQFRNDSLDWGSARRQAATYTQNNTNTEYTHTQTSMP